MAVAPMDINSAIKMALGAGGLGSLGAASLLGTDTVTSRQDFTDSLKNQFGSNWVVGFGNSKIDAGQSATSDSTAKVPGIGIGGQSVAGGFSISPSAILIIGGGVALVLVLKMRGK